MDARRDEGHQADEAGLPDQIGNAGRSVRQLQQRILAGTLPLLRRDRERCAGPHLFSARRRLLFGRGRRGKRCWGSCLLLSGRSSRWLARGIRTIFGRRPNRIGTHCGFLIHDAHWRYRGGRRQRVLFGNGGTGFGIRGSVQERRGTRGAGRWRDAPATRVAGHVRVECFLSNVVLQMLRVLKHRKLVTPLGSASPTQHENMRSQSE